MTTSWTSAWSALDEDVASTWVRIGLNDPVLVHSTFDDVLDDQAQYSVFRDELTDHLSTVRLAGEVAVITTRRLDQLEALHYAIRIPAEEYMARDAAISDLTRSDDLAAYRAAESAQNRAAGRTLALVEAVASLPTQWKGKGYRRKEAPFNPTTRAEAESKALARWSKEVLGILLEAKDDLPFYESIRKARGGRRRGFGFTVLPGSRSNTLKQRVTNWHPFRRCLLANGDGPFPIDPQQALDHLDAAWDGGAPRIFYKSFLSALSFFEAAGERKPEEHVCAEPSVENAVEQLTAKRAQRLTQAEREAPAGAKQAPPAAAVSVPGAGSVGVLH